MQMENSMTEGIILSKINSDKCENVREKDEIVDDLYMH